MTGSKPFPFKLGRTDKKNKPVKNKKIGVGDLRVSESSFKSFGDKHENVRLGNPDEAAEGKAVEITGGPDADNIVAAMDAVMKSEPLTRKSNTNSEPGKPATKQFLLRLTPDEHEQWKLAADGRGVAVAEMVREAVREYLARNPINDGECTHPPERRVRYPWAEICKKCKKRF